MRKLFTGLGRLPLLALAALALTTLVGPEAHAKPTPAKAAPKMLAKAKVDFTGVWIGYEIGEAPPSRKNSSYPMPPPFTPEGQKQSAYWADPMHNQGAKCLPGGGPAGVMNGSNFFPFEIVQRPEQITILYELMQVVRRVFMDGRPHPTGEDLEKTWMGHSTGRWDGDTLVIDTVGVRSGSLNGSGAAVLVMANDKDPRMPYDENLHVVERLRMIDGGKALEGKLTLTDPSVYTRPLELTRYWKKTAFPMLEYICGENPRPADEGYAPRPAEPK